MANNRKSRQARMRKIVAAFQQYVATYSEQRQYEQYSDTTFINDMLYGIGLAMDREKFYAGDGFDRFKEELRQHIGDKQ